jgi:hypothetical protein
MSYTELIEKLQALPSEKQAEVFDFVEFLSARFGANQAATRSDWSDAEFAELAMRQALRGMEDDPVVYTCDDLKERWR